MFRKNNIDQYIDELTAVLNKYSDFMKTSRYDPPESRDDNLVMRVLNSLNKHSDRLNALKSIKDQKPITRNDYNLLMMMPQFRADVMISGYANIIAPEIKKERERSDFELMLEDRCGIWSDPY